MDKRAKGIIDIDLFQDLKGYIEELFVEDESFSEQDLVEIIESRGVEYAAIGNADDSELFGDAILPDEKMAKIPCCARSLSVFDDKNDAAGIGLDDFDEELLEHEEHIQERIRHLSDTFSQYLMYLIDSKGLTNTQVWKDALLDKKVFSKIKNNKNYHPSKITALCLCIGARLNLDETRDLLARAGYALSPCDKTDIIFAYFIENEIYDMIQLDIQLEEYGLPCIIN